MNNLINNIKVELDSLKKEAYFIQVKIKELESALDLVKSKEV